MKAWLIKQRWHLIYGLVILCLLAGTTWQRHSIETQKAELKILKEYVVKQHMAIIEHMYRVHGVAPQQERF